MATNNTRKNADTRKSTRKANDAAKAPKVQVSMALNEAHNGVELTFSAKPTDKLREGLKSAGFRFHGKRQVWYAKQSEDTLAIAKALTEAGADAAEPKPAKEPKAPKVKAEAPKKAPKAEAPKVETPQKAIEFKGNGKPSKRLVKALNACEGLKAEFDRDWVWVSGDTRSYKDALKALGFRFSGRRQAWYLA